MNIDLKLHQISNCKMNFIVLFLSFISVALSYSNQNDVSFYLGLKPNIGGINFIKNYILNEMSNIDSPNYGKFLSKNDIKAFTSPPKDVAYSVKNWLSQNNATKIVNLGDTLYCSMSELQFIKTFKVKLTLPNEDGSVYEIPNEIKEFVSIMELQTSHLEKFFWKTGVTKRHLKQISFGGDNTKKEYITREVLLKTYNIDGGFVTKNVSIGAMEFDGNEGFRQSDMLIAQKASLVKENPVSADHILGINSSPDGESELDMAVIWMAAADADLWYVDYPGWIFGWANYMLNRDTIPKVVSLSWGWNEDAQCSITLCPKNVTSKDYVEQTNIALMKLVARGVTILVSSGDAGSPGRTNELCDKYHTFMNPIFPGGSPWVLSVGASYLSDYKWQSPICSHLECPSIKVESVTSYNQTRWTSGAGFTQWDETPVWQKNAVKKYLNSGVTMPDKKYFNSNGRGYPDVTTYGHNCAVYSDGWIGMDGTSCSAPIMAGIIAFINQHQFNNGKPTVGFVNPLLYKLYERNPNTFNDIWQGNSACTEQMCCNDQNFGYLPVKGIWDVVSGLGSPNVANILRELDLMFYARETI